VPYQKTQTTDDNGAWHTIGAPSIKVPGVKSLEKSGWLLESPYHAFLGLNPEPPTGFAKPINKLNIKQSNIIFVPSFSSLAWKVYRV